MGTLGEAEVIVILIYPVLYMPFAFQGSGTLFRQCRGLKYIGLVKFICITLIHYYKIIVINFTDKVINQLGYGLNKTAYAKCRHTLFYDLYKRLKQFIQ